MHVRLKERLKHCDSMLAENPLEQHNRHTVRSIAPFDKLRANGTSVAAKSMQTPSIAIIDRKPCRVPFALGLCLALLAPLSLRWLDCHQRRSLLICVRRPRSYCDRLSTNGVVSDITKAVCIESSRQIKRRAGTRPALHCDNSINPNDNYSIETSSMRTVSIVPPAYFQTSMGVATSPLASKSWAPAAPS